MSNDEKPNKLRQPYPNVMDNDCRFGAIEGLITVFKLLFSLAFVLYLVHIKTPVFALAITLAMILRLFHLDYKRYD